MAPRPNILTDAAFDVAFEASILLQDTDINLIGLQLNHFHIMAITWKNFYLVFEYKTPAQNNCRCWHILSSSGMEEGQEKYYFLSNYSRISPESKTK